MNALKDFHSLQKYVEQEEKTTKETLRRFGKDLELYQRSFDLCSETVGHICEYAEKRLVDSTAKEAVLFILPRIMQSMQAVRLLTLKGYYYDARIIERSLIEAIGLCAYLALDDKEAKRWIAGKDIKVPKISLFDYVPQLLRIDTGDFSAKSVYGQLCHYVHTNARAIVSLIDTMPDRSPKRVGKKLSAEVKLKFTPKFDRERFREIASSPIIVTIVLSRIFDKELAEKTKRKIRRFVRQLKTKKRLPRNELK